jgi:hypothetical protein
MLKTLHVLIDLYTRLVLIGGVTDGCRKCRLVRPDRAESPRGSRGARRTDRVLDPRPRLPLRSDLRRGLQCWRHRDDPHDGDRRFGQGAPQACSGAPRRIFASGNEGREMYRWAMSARYAVAQGIDIQVAPVRCVGVRYPSGANVVQTTFRDGSMGRIWALAPPLPGLSLERTTVPGFRT